MSFIRRLFNRKRKHVCSEDIYPNIIGCLDPNCPVKRTRKPLPAKAPTPPPAV